MTTEIEDIAGTLDFEMLVRSDTCRTDWRVHLGPRNIAINNWIAIIRRYDTRYDVVFWRGTWVRFLEFPLDTPLDTVKLAVCSAVRLGLHQYDPSSTDS